MNSAETKASALLGHSPRRPRPRRAGRWLPYLLCVLSILCLPPSRAQDNTLTLDDLMDSADQWAKENLDDDALRALQEIDRERVKQFFRELAAQFHNEDVVDLGALNDTAKTMLPLLERYEETAPYAVWLKMRLEYLEVADQLRRTLPVPPPKPGQLPKRPPNPTAAKQREIWLKRLSVQPWPEQAKPLVARLKPIFAEQQVPPDLVWIAEVESGFDARARSPAGAAGLFQLMPATAKRYGLRTTMPDQRLQPEESARAAAKYLKYLHGEFKDWRLALAAYNAGEGTVQKLLDRSKTKTFDAIATHLPAETQMYVPKIEATVLRREGVKLSDLAA